MDVPKLAQREMGLFLSLLVPPAAYAILLVDSGLVSFDFRGLVMVAASSAITAYGWYLYEMKRRE